MILVSLSRLVRLIYLGFGLAAAQPRPRPLIGLLSLVILVRQVGLLSLGSIVSLGSLVIIVSQVSIVCLVSIVSLGLLVIPVSLVSVVCLGSLVSLGSLSILASLASRASIIRLGLGIGLGHHGPNHSL